MGLIYVPERKIQANFKPDFPVELTQSPIADKLIHLFAGSSSGLVDVIGNSPLTRIGNPVPAIGAMGRCAQTSNGLTNGYSFASLATSTSYTIFAVYEVEGAFADVHDYILTDDSKLGTSLQSVTLKAASVNGSVGYSTNDFGNNSQVSYNNYFGPNKVLVDVLVADAVTLTYTIYSSFNGGATYTGALTNTPFVLGSGNAGHFLKIGVSDWFSGAASDLVNIFALGVWDRPVSKTEALSVVNAPFRTLLRPRQRALMIPVSSGAAVALDSSTTATGTGSGTLSVEIPIQSSSVAVASGSGILSQSIPMASSATATVTGTGDLQIAIPLDASAIAAVAGSASMSIAQALAAAGTASGAGSGTLSTNGQMSGSGTAAGTGAATISLSIALSAAAIAHAVGSGQLSLSGSLSGSGTASGTGTGNLTQTIPLVSSSLASVSGTGTMVNSVPLTSSAVVNASGVGMLGVQIGFSAHAFADAISTGNMTLILRLSGQAVAQAVGSGALSQSGILQANPRYTINALGRNFTINALGRNFTINAL